MKRYILALTEAEIGVVRAALKLTTDVVVSPSLTSATVKIGAAITHGAIGINDLRAYDAAAGQMIDGPDWADYNRGRRIKGDPWKARNAIEAATRSKP